MADTEAGLAPFAVKSCRAALHHFLSVAKSCIQPSMLHITNSHLTDMALQELVEAPNFQYIEYLYLEGCTWASAEMPTAFHARGLRRLMRLHLRSCSQELLPAICGSLLPMEQLDILEVTGMAPVKTTQCLKVMGHNYALPPTPDYGK